MQIVYYDVGLIGRKLFLTFRRYFNNFYFYFEYIKLLLKSNCLQLIHFNKFIYLFMKGETTIQSSSSIYCSFYRVKVVILYL